MDNKYYELYININPAMEDDVANICFENFDCEGVLLEEQKFKDLEMTETSKGTLKVFLRSLKSPNDIGVCEFIKSFFFKKDNFVSEIIMDAKIIIHPNTILIVNISWKIITDKIVPNRDSVDKISAERVCSTFD